MMKKINGVNIEFAKNGWTVTLSGETFIGDTKSDEYFSETFVFIEGGAMSDFVSRVIDTMGEEHPMIEDFSKDK